MTYSVRNPPVSSGERFNIPEEIKATLATPGAKIILRALRNHYTWQWRRLKTCTPDELLKIQAIMGAIDMLPTIIEGLANKHLDKKKDKDPGLWFQFKTWCSKFRFDGR